MAWCHRRRRGMDGTKTPEISRGVAACVTVKCGTTCGHCRREMHECVLPHHIGERHFDDTLNRRNPLPVDSTDEDNGQSQGVKGSRRDAFEST